jgi:glycosyltransferase involved in cell wall biosynthesis
VTLTYALVTPARDEADNLRRLGACVLQQTAKPQEWVIVDDGSVDDTAAVARALADRQSYVTVLGSPGATSLEGPLAAGRRAGRDIVAFTHGLSRLARRPDLVVKLDADVSFAPDFFERMLREFETDPRLGIAGGTCYERENGRWRPYRVTGGHVRGATRTYRWACLEDVSPIEERIGWEAVEEARAALSGWKTRSLPELPFLHHRALGARDGARRAWVAQGHLAHYLGYRPSFMLLKIAFRLAREPAAAAMLWGYLEAVARGEPRHPDAAVRSFWRREQSLRRVPGRIREALGLADRLVDSRAGAR